MARLLNSDRAILDLRKLDEYCLNPEHPRGRHKARRFREMLGATRSDAAWLRDILLAAVRERDAAEFGSDAFGSRWRLDIPVTRHGKTVVVRTAWIMRTGQDAPRFLTCWVLE